MTTQNQIKQDNEIRLATLYFLRGLKRMDKTEDTLLDSQIYQLECRAGYCELDN